MMKTVLAFAAAVLTLGGAAFAAEQAPPAPPRTYQVAGDIHVAVIENRNSVFMVGPDTILVADTNFERNAQKLADTIAGVSPKPVRLVIDSHWHGDHIGANALFASKGAVTLAHKNTRARMSVDQVNPVTNTVQLPAQKPEFLPMLTFDGPMSVHFAGEEISLVHYPNGHTDSDVVVYFPRENTVYLGGLLEYPQYAGVYSPKAFIAAIDAVLARTDDNSRLIPWQGRVVNKAELRQWRDIIATMAQRVGAMIAQGKTVQEVVAAKPSREFDAVWGGGRMPDRFAQDMYYALTHPVD
jgi:cyclase